jgi:phage protein U
MNGFMLILGGFPFMLETTPFQNLARSSGWNWPEQRVIGREPALQYTGKQAETVTLTGMLCPELTGDRSSLEALRLLADLGRPLPLVSGTGLFMGLWVIEELSQEEDVHFADGVPRRMMFTLSLKKYGDLSSLLGTALGSLSRVAQLFG